MAAPITPVGAAGYNPEALGATCRLCPLRVSVHSDSGDEDCQTAVRPVPPSYSLSPKAILVCETPGTTEAYKGILACGATGKRLSAELNKVGLPRRDLHILSRIACNPRGNRTQGALKQAAACCSVRFRRELEEAFFRGASQAPILCLGKWSTDGLLSANDLRMSRGIVHNNTMSLPNPTFAFFRSAANSVLFRAGLQRFARWVGSDRRPLEWPNMIIEIGPAMAETLRAMGPVVAWDVETIGIDPLISPISCIGLSDGTHTVSMPWSAYTNRHGHVLGWADYGDTGRACFELVKDILESNRTLVTQNGNYDIGAMRKTGIKARNDIDIMHAYSILWPELPKNLEAIGVHVVEDLPERWKTKFRSSDDDGKTDNAYTDSAEIDLRTYNARDAWVTARAWQEIGRSYEFTNS